jgi:hypothetical protein
MNATRLVIQETTQDIADAETTTGSNKNEFFFLELNLKSEK